MGSQRVLTVQQAGVGAAHNRQEMEESMASNDPSTTSGAYWAVGGAVTGP